MMLADRSFSEVFQDILLNVQDIVRSEVRLARAELREEAIGAKQMTLLFGAGAAAALIAAVFLLLGAVYALALILPSWAAALIVGTSLTLVAWALLSSGIKRFRNIYGRGPTELRPEKEQIEWTKQQSR